MFIGVYFFEARLMYSSVSAAAPQYMAMRAKILIISDKML